MTISPIEKGIPLPPSMLYAKEKAPKAMEVRNFLSTLEIGDSFLTLDSSNLLYLISIGLGIQLIRRQVSLNKQTYHRY